ncbi:MAG: hypothetical protein CML67_01105, partial [Rhodobacteraceae bacterium]|nr:hypothetical protein [Paracoccaceae bacterium]
MQGVVQGRRVGAIVVLIGSADTRDFTLAGGAELKFRTDAWAEA